MIYCMTYLQGDDKFLVVNGEEVVKFGHTSDIDQRMKTYRSNMPMSVVLLCELKGGYEEEQQLLYLIRDYCVTGEWHSYQHVKVYLDTLHQEPVVYPKQWRGRISNPMEVKGVAVMKQEHSLTDRFIEWVSQVKDGLELNKKDFDKQLSVNDQKNLQVMLSNPISKPRKLLTEMGIERHASPGRYGTTIFR